MWQEIHTSEIDDPDPIKTHALRSHSFRSKTERERERASERAPSKKHRGSRERKIAMENMKKRKLGEVAAEDDEISSVEELRTLLDPLAKPQLVDLLAKLYFSILIFSLFSFNFVITFLGFRLLELGFCFFFFFSFFLRFPV